MATGADLLTQLNQLLNEDSDSGWIDEATSYNYLHEAAIEFVSRTGFLPGTDTITTVSGQREYSISTDFLKLYLKNASGDYYLKYNNGTDDFFITWKDYEDIIYSNQTDSVPAPSKFSIISNTSTGGYKLVLDPPPNADGHTITLYYIKTPLKVASASAEYPFPDHICFALVKYAFWLYKYRDSDPNFGDAMFKLWDRQIRQYARDINQSIRPSGLKVNMRKRQ